VATQLLGDPCDRAFERLYERYVQDVYRYALAVLRNPADAEDVTQTTFMNAYRAMKNGEEPLKPQHWLIKIAHNACRTRAIRASRRPREVPLDETVGELAVPEHERPNIKAILGALGRLPFNQRSALVMRELEGRTYEDIADTLGVSVSAVETLIFRARRSLRVSREALRGLLAIPLPASLESWGNNAVSAGGIALGGGAATKVAAVIAAVIAGGAGFEAVDTSLGGHKAAPKPASPEIAIGAAIPIGGPALGVHPAARRVVVASRTAGSQPAPHTGAGVSATPRAAKPDGGVSAVPKAPSAAAPVAGPTTGGAASGTAPAKGGALRNKARSILPKNPIRSLPVPSLPSPSLPAVPTVTVPTAPAVPDPPAAPPPPTLPAPPALPPPPSLPSVPDPSTRPPLP
jgi:RNA polymerase sigma factor (sigma-70 family)